MKKILSSLLILSFLSPANATVYSVGLDKTQYTSDFMIGSVAVSIIFAESNGGTDPNVENWDDARKGQVLSEIMAGLDWWTHQNSRSPLSFTYTSQTVTTKYEPITRPYYDEALWIPEIMGKLGYTGSRFVSTRAYCNALRQQYNTDWAFVIFMVDSQADSNGKFADGYFAYSYLGGPFTVMTYDNNGYGISNMDVVTAHEIGHIFNALDQYAGASSPSSYSYGYFPTINGNHQYAATANDANSIMRGGVRWGLDYWAKLMIGWRDSDNNGRDDILDRTPTLTMNQGSGNSFAGNAHVNVLPRQDNSSGYGFTVDSIAKVEYKVGDEDWGEAAPADGIFDEPDENFVITIPSSQLPSSQAVVSASDINLRVVTAFSSYVGTADSGGSGATLADAHPFPNPFKPNSHLGHGTITFTNLTTGAKVQIFTPAGEPVLERMADSNNVVTWPEASSAASGVYYFLITDESGHKKKGKLAVIR